MSEKDFGQVIVRADGSYVIDNGTYHVPAGGEFAALHADIKNYLQAHPGQAQPESPGPAYEWLNGAWVYNLRLDSPGPDYVFDETADNWVKVRFTKKDFLFLCGFEQIVALNQAINQGNVVAKTVHDLLLASEYIDLTDADTIKLVQLLATPEAGQILTPEEADKILKGLPYVNPA